MRRAVGATLLVLVVVGGITALLLWRDAEAAETSLQAARTALNEGEQALSGEHDDDAARAAFTTAREHVDDAQGRLDGLGWDLVEALPRVGGSARVAQAAADLAGASADLGLAVVDEADALLDGSALEGVLGDGRIDLARLDELAGRVDALPVAPVREARDRLVAVPESEVIARLQSDRADAVAQVDRLLGRLDRATTGLEAFRSFLGADGPRTYLVAAQNPAELRGTGGLIGFFTELSLQDGEIALGDGQSVDVEEELAQRNDIDSIDDLPEPVSRPAAFADRYDHVAGGSFFGSVNSDPDLPTVAPVLLELYEQQVGPSLDGVLLVDPVALGRIVETTGEPLQLPEGVQTGGLPRAIPGEDLARMVMVDGYDALDGGGEAKKAFDRAVITAGFERLTAGGWDPVAMGHTLAEVFATRHMQLYSRDEGEQTAFELLGLAGEMTSSADAPRDVLAVTGINAAANKMDVQVAHRMSGDIALGAVRDTAPGSAMRTGTLTVEVDNPTRPDDHHRYITSSQGPRDAPGSEYVVNALARTWFSVWTLPTTEVRELREDGEPQPFRANNIHDHRVFDYFLETPSQTTTSFELDLEGRVELARDGDAMVYELVLWRQAKAIPDHWDLAVSPPPGWSVESASVEGGGELTGMGPGGDDGSPITADVVDGAVEVRGAVTRDATLRVRLTRG